MNHVSMKGLSGAVRWAYHCAATVGPWTLVTDPTGSTLTAQVVSHDAFKVSQQPLTFVVARPNGQWIWPIESLQIAGSTLTARLGPQQE